MIHLLTSELKNIIRLLDALNVLVTGSQDGEEARIIEYLSHSGNKVKSIRTMTANAVNI